MNDILLFLTFISVLTSTFLGMQYLVYSMYRAWVRNAFNLQNQKKLITAVHVFLAFGNSLFFARFFIAFSDWHELAWIQNFIVKPGGIFFAIIFLLFLCSVLFHLWRILKSLLKKYANKRKLNVSNSLSTQETESLPLSRAEESQQTRREFLRQAGTVVFTAPLILTTGLSIATHRNYQIVQKTLLYPQLPSGLEGLRIAHISDIHSGIFMNRNQIAEIFELINRQHPNLVMITGDLVDTHPSEIPAIQDTIDLLKSDYGVFTCPGNHDHYASIEGLTQALESTKANFLKNDAKNLIINGEPFSVLGIDDAGLGNRDFSDLGKALSKSTNESFKLLLSHRPDMFDKAINHGIDLTLSGHTHGGQIGFEFAGVELYPIDLFQKYSRGHYQYGDKQLYVNVGVGLVGAPIRLVRPEITIFTLTSNPKKVMHKIIDA